jgi:hypothetical protein
MIDRWTVRRGQRPRLRRLTPFSSARLSSIMPSSKTNFRCEISLQFHRFQLQCETVGDYFAHQPPPSFHRRESRTLKVMIHSIFGAGTSKIAARRGVSSRIRWRMRSASGLLPVHSLRLLRRLVCKSSLCCHVGFPFAGEYWTYSWYAGNGPANGSDFSDRVLLVPVHSGICEPARPIPF